MATDFYVMAVRHALKDPISIPKCSFDMVNFYMIPTDYQNIKFHPFLMKKNLENVLLKENTYRNVKFAIYKKDQSFTPEAEMYLNKDLNFELKINNESIVLSKESIYDESVQSIDIQCNLSGSEIMKRFDSIDEDDDSNNVNSFANSTKVQENKDLMPLIYHNILQSNRKSFQSQNAIEPIPNFNQISKLASHTESTVKKIKINSIFNELSQLKKVLGCYKVFNDARKDAQDWITEVEVYLMHNYQSITDIIEYFHTFLDHDFHNWLFKLDVDTKSDWKSFKKSFLDEAFRIEKEYVYLSIAKKSEFIELLKKKNPNKKDYLVKLEDEPFFYYFKEKIIILQRLNSTSKLSDLVKQSIFLLDKDEERKLFYKFRNSDLKGIGFYAKFLDSQKK